MHDSMSLILPPFTKMAHRYVSIDNEIWELWSPNVGYHAFYPGFAHVAQDFNEAAPRNLPRSDGHLGRFDPTMNPQVFNPLRPWLPFIKRPNQVEDQYPEYVPFLEVWDGRSGQLHANIISDYVGRIKAVQDTVAYCETYTEQLGPVWTQKPKIPTQEDLASLTQCKLPEEACSRYAMLQRSIKEIATWSKYVRALAIDPPAAVNDETAIPHAFDQFMGLWLNACPMDHALMYLRARIPCFVIHTVESFTDRYYFEHSNLRPLSSFISGTEVQHRLGYYAQCDGWYRSLGWKMVSFSRETSLS